MKARDVVEGGWWMVDAMVELWMWMRGEKVRTEGSHCAGIFLLSRGQIFSKKLAMIAYNTF